ncbi:hypothetical protein AAE478_001530 [Parahypoxylon ruwenzoriense]
MSERFEIPGLTFSSRPEEAHQPQPSIQNEAQLVTPENPDAMVNDDTTVNDAPPSPPSLTSALEALLGGLDPLPQDLSAAAATQTNGTEQNGQPHNQEAQPPQDDQQSEPGWEEDSSPYESSSESSSSDDSDDESEGAGNYKLLGPEETARILMEMEGGSDDEGEGKAKGAGSGVQVRTKNEMPEEVIPKPDVVITHEMGITELGVVEHIVENTVVIKANTTGEYSVLDSGSVLCVENRTVIAAIADLIGNVRQPRYTARFTNEEEIKSYGLDLGTKIFYPPSHASYVFTQALRGEKGTDASNWHDEEVGADEIEFSDDEKEAEYKRQLKGKKKGGRGGKAGAGGRGGQHETPASSQAGGLKYDDDDDDGPYRKLARPAGFGQVPATASEPGYTNGNTNNGGTFRGGRGRGQRGHGFDRSGRGNRGGPRGGHSLPPRPPRGQEYQPQSQPHQYNYSSAPPLPLANAAFPPPPPQFQGAPNGHQHPTPQFPFPWPQNMPQSFVPPPPPQFTGQQPEAGAYYNPAFFAALQNQMQGQSGQQNGHWNGHGGPG